MDGRARPARGGARRKTRRSIAGKGILELGETVWDAVGLYAELRSRRTYLGGRGGGSGGHGGSQRKGAAAATPARKRRRGSAVCARQTKGRGSSPRYDAQGEENGDGEATSREIDDSGGELRNRAELDAFLRRRRWLRGVGSP
jgi:hypothetical protein